MPLFFGSSKGSLAFLHFYQAAAAAAQLCFGLFRLSLSLSLCLPIDCLTLHKELYLTSVSVSLFSASLALPRPFSSYDSITSFNPSIHQLTIHSNAPSSCKANDTRKLSSASLISITTSSFFFDISFLAFLQHLLLTLFDAIFSTVFSLSVCISASLTSLALVLLPVVSPAFLTLLPATINRGPHTHTHTLSTSAHYAITVPIYFDLPRPLVLHLRLAANL